MQETKPDPQDPVDREILTSQWLRYAETGDRDLFWCYEALPDLIDEDPAIALTVILELLRRAATEDVFNLAATGPLEDLVSWHGEEVIEHIEQQGDDESLRRALTRIYLSRGDLPEEVLERYRGLAEKRIG
jgi:hypothetical protein